MVYDLSYTDRIRHHLKSSMERNPPLLQLVSWGTLCVPSGLGRNGQAALMGLYSLSKHCSGDASRHPNGPAAVARGSERDARPEPAAAPDSRCTTSGCSAPAGEPRGRPLVGREYVEHAQYS
jgi:hypothetical protein